MKKAREVTFALVGGGIGATVPLLPIMILDSLGAPQIVGDVLGWLCPIGLLLGILDGAKLARRNQ